MARVIVGVALARPTKADIASEIARMLGLGTPYVSTGSSVDSVFLDDVHVELAGGPTGGADTYRKVEAVLARLGLTYDPYWDSSESSPTGGGTVTTRAYSRIRTAISGVPRCFLLRDSGGHAPNFFVVGGSAVYHYDESCSGRSPLNDAGPASRVVLYGATGQGPSHLEFTGTATIEYIAPGWAGPWDAQLRDYEVFTSPVPIEELEMPAWPRAQPITEVSFETYSRLTSAGGLPQEASERVVTIFDQAGTGVDDLGGSQVAERVLSDFPAAEVDIIVRVPDDLPQGRLRPEPAVAANYDERDDRVVTADSAAVPGRRRQDAKRDRLAELRAIELATRAMIRGGWRLARDRQADGVGYDLEFERDARTLKVEVKGIQGPDVVFNLTPKELWRAETDDAWVLLAVTSVLSPTEPKPHLLPRDRVVAAKRVVTGYRLTVL
jgi:hypothetical protein